MSSKPLAVIILSRQIFDRMFREQDLAPLRAVMDVVGPIEGGQLAAHQKDIAEAVVAIGGWGTPRFGGDILALMPKLKMLAYSAGSVKGVVSDDLYDRHIRVTTGAAGNAVAVAQFTLATMVMLLKQQPWLTRAMAKNDLAELQRRMPFCRELQDMSVGLVAASRVGREVITLLHDYPGLNILVHDPFLTEAQARELKVRRASLDEVCGCTVVSVHAPNIPATHHMINARTLGLMPDHGVFINTSRGALVDEAALVAEVRRRPLYVALDVTDPEPPAPDSPLLREPNIILTPHIAGAMGNACKDMGRLTIDEILRFHRGEKLGHEVTREMLATQA